MATTPDGLSAAQLNLRQPNIEVLVNHATTSGKSHDEAADEQIRIKLVLG